MLSCFIQQSDWLEPALTKWHNTTNVGNDWQWSTPTTANLVWNEPGFSRGSHGQAPHETTWYHFQRDWGIPSWMWR